MVAEYLSIGFVCGLVAMFVSLNQSDDLDWGYEARSYASFVAAIVMIFWPVASAWVLFSVLAYFCRLLIVLFDKFVELMRE